MVSVCVSLTLGTFTHISAVPLAGSLSVTNDTTSIGNKFVPAESLVNLISPPPLSAGLGPSASNISEGRLSSENRTGISV